MEEFISLLFGNEGATVIFVFVIFTFFGSMWIKVYEYNKIKKCYNKDNYPERMEFDFGHWVDDNFLDIVLALMTAFGVFRFFPDALGFIERFEEVPKFVDKMAYGLGLGLSFQYLLHKLMNKVTVQKTIDKVQGQN